MKLPALSTLLVMAIYSLEPAAAQGLLDPSYMSVKPVIDAWRMCVLEKTRESSRSTQPADELATAALFHCRVERAAAYEAAFHIRPSRAPEVIASLETELRRVVIASILDGRQK
jgi:hypothetical protein